MTTKLVLLTIPGLRAEDVDHMPNLKKCMAGGTTSRIQHSFPCVTWPSQANMLTGRRPNEHGVVANGFYWRDKREVEMWTAWNEVIQRPQIWDVLHEVETPRTSLAWFPMLSKGAGADYVCMPAPIHQPDGSEDLWCYTKPQDFYGDLLESLGHFPLQHFWGPLAGIQSSNWIIDSVVLASRKFQPDFSYIYLPHLDYAAQKCGPDSTEANDAVVALDEALGRLTNELDQIYDEKLVWMAVSEYVITEVDHVTFPNRVLREAGLLNTTIVDGTELIDFMASKAWALVDHQLSHIFVKDSAKSVIEQVVELFQGHDGIENIMPGENQSDWAMNHERSGDVILISTANSWQAYYWWLDNEKAPAFARQVDIHRKPGYDPIELHFDFATKSVPLDASLAKGSHGAPPQSDAQRGIFLSSEPIDVADQINDVDIFKLVLDQFE